MPLVILDGPTIPAGEALSEALDCSGGDIVRVTMPAAWDNAALSFQVSTDGEFFNDLYLADGREVVMLVKPKTGVIVTPQTSVSVNFIKFRSGTADHPVPQRESRQFAVAVKTP